MLRLGTDKLLSNVQSIQSRVIANLCSFLFVFGFRMEQMWNWIEIWLNFFSRNQNVFSLTISDRSFPLKTVNTFVDLKVTFGSKRGFLALERSNKGFVCHKMSFWGIFDAFPALNAHYPLSKLVLPKKKVAFET